MDKYEFGRDLAYAIELLEESNLKISKDNLQQYIISTIINV